MSNKSKLFESIPIDLKKRSGFDLSHENLMTQKCGTITPILTEFLLPNDTISLGYFAQMELPPVATNFYGRIDVCIEAFFVPCRLLWGGWKYFWTRPQPNPFNDGVFRPTALPSLFFTEGSESRGSLADCLGLKVNSTSEDSYIIPNALPFLAYHRIYDDHYRNKNVMKPLFLNPNVSNTPADILTHTPYITLIDSTNTSPIPFTVGAALFHDGLGLTDLRQRQWGKDYYTTASLYPQAAVTPSSVAGSVSGSSATFTISQLRQANVLQRWYERNNLAGFDYPNQIYAQYGITPPDSLIDKAIFLSQDKFSLYSRSVVSTASVGSATNNPFTGILGAKGGNLSGMGKSSLIESFTAKEHGFLMVMSTIVPHAYYSTGSRRYLFYETQADIAQPLLEGVGEQPIYDFELCGNLLIDASGSHRVVKSTFGYQQQYSEYKYHDDEVHGLLVDGQSLSAFCLQRSFSDTADIALSSDFLLIPQNFLDQVLAVNTVTSGYGAWADYFFEFKKISSLSEYVIPTLGDMRNTYKGHLPYRGTDIRG